MKEVQGSQPGPSKIWCYNCSLWLKENRSEQHFSGKSHREGKGKDKKKTRRGLRKSAKRKAKLLQEGVFTKQFIVNDEENDPKDHKIKVGNIEEYECVADPADVAEKTEMASRAFSRPFIESDDVAELGSRSPSDCEPVGYRYRRQDNDHMGDNAAHDCEKKSVVPSADDIHPDVCLDSIPLPKEYLVNDPSMFQNWDNLIKIENEYKDPARHSYDLRH